MSFQRFFARVRSSVAFLGLSLVPLLTLACGSSGSSGSSGSANNSSTQPAPGSTQDPTMGTTPKDMVERFTVTLYPDTVSVAASDDSTCDELTEGIINVDLVAHQLSWRKCHFDAPNRFTMRISQRALTDAELAAIEQTRGQLKTDPKGDGQCLAGQPMYTLDEFLAMDTWLYIGEFGCDELDSVGRDVARGITAIYTQLDALSDM